MMNDSGHFFYGGGFMWIFWILFIVIILYVVLNLSRSNSNGSSSNSESPLEILKKRYARGEIEEEEYLKRRKELEKD